MASSTNTFELREDDVVDFGLALALGCVLLWVLFSARLSRWSVTAPILLAAAGFALGSGSNSLVQINVQAEGIRLLAELTLAIILFTDASQIQARWFGHAPSRIAARLLLVGLPLSIAAGIGAGLLLFPESPVIVLAVVATSLAATDAALSASVISDSRIALKLRQVINVESGLNDGLATPFVLFFIAVASAEGTSVTARSAITDAVGEIAIAIGVGIVIGAIGGRLLAVADARGWSLPMQEPIGTLAIALMCYAASVAAGGNGFVAAFVGGVAFGTAVRTHRPPEVMDFAERIGLLLSFAVWFIFGAVFVRSAFGDLTWHVIVYALMSLTVVRMVPVALCLFRSGLTRDDVLLIGWLGPRGLASIVFALIAFDALSSTDGAFIAQVITVTVTFSVVLHGVTAGPVASWFSSRHPAPPDEQSALAQVRLDT